MAASGYSPIVLFNSSTSGHVPTTANLAAGELALNIADGVLYFNQLGSIVPLAKSAYATNVITFSGGSTGLTPNSATSGAIILSGTLNVANGGTGVTTSTGSGNNVLSTSPTLVTPALGTPSSATLTNATGLPLTTGVTGMLPVANGGTGVTTSTGSGSTVLSTSPTLVTPILGTPTSVTLTNATGLPLSTGVTGTLPTANGGTGLTSFTANGVVYASSTSALTTGSALTFDGTNLILTGSSRTNQLLDGAYLQMQNAGATANWFLQTSGLNLSFTSAQNGAAIWSINGSEQMRLTSTGLGIGTSSPGAKLDVNGNALIYGITVGRGAGAVSTNTAVGASALQANTTGASNAAVGYQAGYGITTGASNTYLGYVARESGVAVTNEVVVGASLTGKGSNTAFIGGTSGAYNGANSLNWSVTSDQRIKKNIVDNNIGLDIINQIQVRNFEYRLPEEITDVPQDQAIQKQGLQLGVIAQELQQILPKCVKTESTGVMTVDADNLIWYLVNAVKELTTRLAALEAK